MLDARLETFLVLCDTMHYTRAAEQLGLTQPSVTHHIQYLEAHYGCRLFAMEGKTLRLTEAGERLRGMARSLAYNSRKMESALSESGHLSLRVGATKTIGEFVIAKRVGRFLRRHPDCAFSLTVDNTRELLEKLEKGELDFALLEGFFDQGKFSSHLFRQEVLFGVCAPEHPLAGRRVPLESLLGERLIVREAGSGTRDIFEMVLRRHHRTLSSFAHTAEISDFATIKSLVMEGLGIAFLYAPVVEQECAAGCLARFDLEGEPITGAFHLVYLRDNLFSSDWADWLEV